RHLQDRGRALFQHAREFVFGDQPLAGRDRDRRAARDQRHLLRHFRRRRFLEPQGIIGLDPLGEADGAGSGELPALAEEEVSLAADRLAQQAAELLRAIERFQRRLAWIERGVRRDRIELNRGEAELHILGRALRRELGIVIDALVLVALRVDEGVAAYALMYAAAQELIDRLAGRLAHDVPQRDLDAREHADQRRVGALGVAAAVDAAPQALDVERIH